MLTSELATDIRYFKCQEDRIAAARSNVGAPARAACEELSSAAVTIGLDRR